ncbi:MAG TPA: hypothetical protein VGM22_10500 [Methylomirabilota bacterium]
MTPALDLLKLLEELDRKGTSVIDLVRGGQPLVPWRSHTEAGYFHTVRLFAGHTAHLAAISMTTDGWPQALFTLNLWAMGDDYEPARLRRYVREFRLAEQVGPPPLVRFVNLMFQAFGPEIERLQDEKIARLDRYRAVRAAAREAAS